MMTSAVEFPSELKGKVLVHTKVPVIEKQTVEYSTREIQLAIEAAEMEISHLQDQIEMYLEQMGELEKHNSEAEFLERVKTEFDQLPEQFKIEIHIWEMEAALKDA